MDREALHKELEQWDFLEVCLDCPVNDYSYFEEILDLMEQRVPKEQSRINTLAVVRKWAEDSGRDVNGPSRDYAIQTVRRMKFWLQAQLEQQP